jgi:two-component system sensor histidine kinase YcbA
LVIALRVLAGTLTWPHGGLAALLRLHFPGGLYYVVFSLFLTVLGFRRRMEQAAGIVLTVAVADAGANLVEILVRGEMHSAAQFPYFMGIFIVIALIRSTIVLGLYHLAESRHLEEMRQLQKAKYRDAVAVAGQLLRHDFLLRRCAGMMESAVSLAYSAYETLRREGADESLPVSWRERASGLSRQALELARTVHEIKKNYHLAVSGVEALREGTQPDLCLDLRETVELSVEVNRAYARRLHKQISFSTWVPADVDRRLRDPMAVATIVNNLLTNAVEAVSQTGAVWVEVGQENGSIVIRVRDSGPGIPESDWELIFEPGYSTKRDSEGAFSPGIGLAHVKHLVTGFGGSIFVRSRPGCTEFCLSLPAHTLFADDGS